MLTVPGMHHCRSKQQQIGVDCAISPAYPSNKGWVHATGSLPEAWGSAGPLPLLRVLAMKIISPQQLLPQPWGSRAAALRDTPSLNIYGDVTRKMLRCVLQVAYQRHGAAQGRFRCCACWP